MSLRSNKETVKDLKQTKIQRRKSSIEPEARKQNDTVMIKNKVEMHKEIEKLEDPIEIKPAEDQKSEPETLKEERPDEHKPEDKPEDKSEELNEILQESNDIFQEPEKFVEIQDFAEINKVQQQEEPAQLEVDLKPQEEVVKIAKSPAKSTTHKYKNNPQTTPKPKQVKINETKLIRGDEVEFGKIGGKEDSTAKILQRLYRAHRKFNLIIDEDIEVDRDKIREKIRLLSLNKDKQPLFSNEDSSNLEEYEKGVERKIIRLDDQNYKDKWVYIEEWFQIKDGDNQYEYENFEEIK